MGFGWKDFFIGAALVAASFIPGLNATVASMFLAGGLSFVAKAIPKPTLEQQRQGALVQGVSTQNAVRIVYGEARVAGQIVFEEAEGESGDTPNAYLDMVGVLCMGSREPQAGEAADSFRGMIGSVGPVWFDDYQAFKTEPVEVNLTDGYWKLDPDENLTSAVATGLGNLTFFSVAAMWAYLGMRDQVANQYMIDRWGGHERWDWSSDHRLRGVAYFVMNAFYRQVKFPRGVPNVTAYVGGRRCYDPRLNDGAGGWPFDANDNASLVVRDYLLDPIAGGAVSIDKLNESSFVVVADRCDEIVTNPDGTVRRRHTINGVVDTGRSVKQNVQDMLRGFQSFLVYEQGEFHLRQQVQDVDPVDLVLDQSNIVGDWSFGTTDVENRVNLVIGNFVDKTVPSDDPEVDTPLKDQIMQAQYPTQDIDPNPYVVEDGGVELPREVDFPFIDNLYECEAACQAELEVSRAIVTAALTAKEVAMQLGLTDKVRIHHPRPDWNKKEFWIEGLGLQADQNVRIAVREVTPGADYGFPGVGSPPELTEDYPLVTTSSFCRITHGAQQDPPENNSSGSTGHLLYWNNPPPEDEDHADYEIEIIRGPCANFDPTSSTPGPGFDCGQEGNRIADADDFVQPIEWSVLGFGFGNECSNKRCSAEVSTDPKWYKARWLWKEGVGGPPRSGPWSPAVGPQTSPGFEDDPRFSEDPDYCKSL